MFFNQSASSQIRRSLIPHQNQLDSFSRKSLEMPTIDCSCGESINVEEFEAGSSKRCLECGATHNIPSLAKLRMLEGEANPYLDSMSRLIMAIAESRSPFDGQCLKCGEKATREYPVYTRFVRERVSSSHPVRSGLTGVELDFSSEEEWARVMIPFRFCGPCGAVFKCRAVIGRLLLIAGFLTAIAIGLPVFLVAQEYGIIIMLPLLWGVAQIAGRMRCDRRLDPYITRNPLLKKVFSGEDELVVRIGRRINL